MLKLLWKFRRDDAGNSLVEYSILLGLLLAVSVAVLQGSGGSLATIFSKVSSSLASSVTGSG